MYQQLYRNCYPSDRVGGRRREGGGLVVLVVVGVVGGWWAGGWGPGGGGGQRRGESFFIKPGKPRTVLPISLEKDLVNKRVIFTNT